ncbi:TIGR03435 family protein [Acidicapsa dinghuensis]|uniref:TIGR03435 family protein n=1 Tax=Acidicapsa dinghuensis TaxID=2218256 RepID=A0ABW1EFM8_9BACT|nr:M56 family metallopeptidase [Acidicapsa dinghuensis]
MSGVLTIIGTRIGPALANHLWQSTGFVVLVWLLTMLLRKDRARTRHLLWFAASLKFLIPLSVLIGLGAHSLKLQPTLVPQGTSLSTTAHILEQPFSSEERTFYTENSTSQRTYSDWLIPAAALAWMLGAMVIVSIWVMRWKKVSRLQRMAFPSEQGTEVEALRTLELQMGLRRKVVLLRSKEMTEPGIFGIFRPALLWPERLTEQLTTENLDAILAHELMHVRRQDNLIAAIHMVVEAVFWFHPMVWWIESHMLEERERACDEAAVEQTSRPEVYAMSLLKACRFCAESPMTCISGITGADLKTRVIRILSNPVECRISLQRRIALAVVAILCVSAPVTLGIFGQAQENTATSQANTEKKLPEFDVASIKPHKDDPASGMMIGVQFTPDGVKVSGMPLNELIRAAFGISQDRVLGTLGWTKTARYDIEAKVSAADVSALDKIKMEDRWAMMLSLLQDRFGLKYHHETKELQVYTLVAGKGGPKLKESPPEAGDDKNHAKQMMRMSSEGMTMEGDDAPIENLAHALSLQLGATVIDKTGLTGKYDYKMTWVPEQGMPMMPHGPGEGSEPGGGATTRPTGPSLVAALQEQLGLKLESKKELVDVIVVDQINQPSPN